MEEQPLPQDLAHTDCNHPFMCMETGRSLPGFGPDGAFVDVSGDRPSFQCPMCGRFYPQALVIKALTEAQS